MSSTDSAPTSQKHCKKQMTSFLSSNSSSSNLNSNAKVEVSVNIYPFTKSSTICPPEISTTCLPNVSKHIKQTLRLRNQPPYTVKLPNTSKSLPIQTKLGAYFKSIAENNTRNNPSLRPMQYKRSNAMLRLGATITKTNICAKPFSSASSSPLMSTPPPTSKKPTSESASISHLSFWSHSSTDASQSNPHEDILIRDEQKLESSSFSHLTSSVSDSSDTSQHESTSVFTSPSESYHHNESCIITRAQKRTSLPNPSVHSDIFRTHPYQRNLHYYYSLSLTTSGVTWNHQ